MENLERKFGTTGRNLSKIEGCSDDNETETTNKFAEFFFVFGDKNIANDKAKDIRLCERLSEYVGDACDVSKINVELVESIVGGHKKGKAAGRDNLSVEHLKFAHPLVRCTLASLFRIMVKVGYVPDAFGEGVTIPIPKGDKNQIFNKLRTMCA